MNRRDFLKRLGLMPFILALRPKVDLPEEPLEHDHTGDDGPELSHDHTGPCFDIETKYCLSGPCYVADEEIEAYYEAIQDV